jgi:hypothetical protein
VSRFATFDTASGYIRPRLDALGPNRRLDPHAPPVMAYLEGRPVFLVRPDPRYRRARMGRPLTVPLTVSRMQRAYDLERGYDPGPYEPSLVDDVPLDTPFAGTSNRSQYIAGGLMAIGLGAVFGGLAGAVIGDVTAWQGAKVGGVAAVGLYAVGVHAVTS